MPTCLHFPSQNRPKSFQKSISEGIDFLIDFGIDICTVLAPSWDPTWGHVDHFFAQDGGTEFKAPFFFVGSMLFFDLGALMAPSWHHLARFWRVRGSILEVFARITPTCAIQQRLLSPGKANRAAHNSKSKPSLTHPHQPPHEQTCQGVGGCSGSF